LLSGHSCEVLPFVGDFKIMAIIRHLNYVYNKCVSVEAS